MATAEIASRAEQPMTAGSTGRPSNASFRWGMVVPTLLALLAVIGFPIAYALYVSVHRYDLTEGGIGAVTWLKNFRDVLGMQVFIEAIRNTIVLTVSVVVVELIVAFGL